MVNEIVKAMENSKDCAVFVEGDYYKPYFDDEPELKVIVCGVCGKPKECYPFISTVFGNSGKPPKDKRKYPLGVPVKRACLCDCDVDRKRKAESEYRKRKASAFRKMDCWGYTDEYGTVQRNMAMEQTEFCSKDSAGTLKTKSNKHIKACEKYISTLSQRLESGKGLFLCGKSGAGKTYAAICFANALMDRMFSVCFKEQWQITGFSQFDSGDKSEMAKLESISFLIIDDFNPDKLNDYGREVIFNLFDTRIKRKLPTVFTSNATENSIKNPHNAADKRIMDRIIQNCHIIEDSTNNYRRAENGITE